MILFAQCMIGLFVFVAVNKAVFLVVYLFRLKPTKEQYQQWIKENRNG